jgi:hypothetical protein
MTDFRALCAELADALHNAVRVIHHEDGTKHISTAYLALNRARAALAEPQPAADDAVAATGKPGLQVEPIPMSERLPEAEDCDAEGRCWWWHPPTYAASTGWWSFEPWEWTEDVTHWLPAHALPLPNEVE